MMSLALGLGLGMGGNAGGGAAPEYAPLTGSERFSIGLGFRNGDNSTARYIAGPTPAGGSFQNMFGSGTNAGAGSRAAMTIAVRLRFQPSARCLDSDAANVTSQMPIMGNGAKTASRSQSLWYWPPNVATALFFRNKFSWHIQSGNGIRAGSISSVDGSTGSADTNRALHTASIVLNDDGTYHGVVVVRGGASGAFEMFEVKDNAIIPGSTDDPASYALTFLGNATPTNSFNLGCISPAPAAALNAYYSGDINDLLICDFSAADADLKLFEQGADPATIWPASTYAYYPCKNTTDLAKSAASTRPSAAFTLGGTGHVIGPQIAPTYVSSKPILARLHHRGEAHSILSTSFETVCGLAPAARTAALRLATGDVVRDVWVGSTATAIEGRAIQQDTDLVTKAWAQVAASGSGWVTTTMTGVLQGRSRFQYRRVDDPTNICTVYDEERVALDVLLGPSQSQVDIATHDATSRALATTALTTSLVTYVVGRGRGTAYLSPDGGVLSVNGQLSDAMTACAMLWEASAIAVPLNLTGFSVPGKGSFNWIYHDNASGQDCLGDGSDRTSGYATTMMIARRKRFTASLDSWSTDDQGTYNGGATGSFTTIYGSKNPTERPWTERMAELWSGVAKVGAGAPEVADRGNFTKQALMVSTPVVLLFPRSRYRSASANPATDNPSTTAFRKIMRDWAVLGTGRDTSAIKAHLGGHQCDTILGLVSGGDTEHQDRTDPGGNITFAMRMVQGLLYWAAGIGPNPDNGFSTATGIGTNVLTLPCAITAGSTLDALINGTVPQEFEVSDNTGANFSKLGGAIAFTPAISGSSITLTKTSGNWPAGTQVRYLYGYPGAIGSTQQAAEKTLTQGMLVEKVSGLVPAAVLALTSTALGGGAMQSYIPIAPTMAPIVAT